ncbi:MAG: cell division topological specificity factor MinE [Meiothermus sp.]|uniref:cell division topological specificity factor MinE n=1 Tax=Meiothermus sp. TaxID=1955249 RepID=UPI0025F109B2|nr:cell division topological specificity factor MinE [Meiothermus sp.]MCS7059500.1 cell division topological specificity factor MinE [Meiothermus sp.]MCS7194027.1 cell division topological specificity factor MinE [Meiothermus sp.]MCX7740286.1 cell division topological specificity factor MinE [Meiothermus sp.]MDW8090235.1 cell division topological specificity factor MinE [Meiothermus sp.]MDW8481203.1 cell division topological specificity factor MinE [Meiothermus sp.]
MGWWPFSGKSSREQLKERLKVVLAYDRAHLSPGLVEQLKQDLLDVLKRYFPEEEGISIQVETLDDKMKLHADVPIPK